MAKANSIPVQAVSRAFDCAQAYPRKLQFSLTIPCRGGIVKA